MRTTILNIALLLGTFSMNSTSFAKGADSNTKSVETSLEFSKKLAPLETHHLNFNLFNFCNYLENGNPKKAEGVYQSPDGRYVIALIKNDEKGHDFIGVVCAADNPFWKRGEVKFNFVLDSNNELNGYYYNSSGEYVPVSFTIDGDSLKTNKLIKVDAEKIKATTIAWL
ncbi:MAG: hypothetical protein ACJAV5_001355 [Vicingaceae bacterium]|jgi:hypothetical protein